MLSITREQVRTSSDVDTHRPVSRRNEVDFFAHYGYFPYWGGPTTWGRGIFPGGLEPELADDADVLAADDSEWERAERMERRRDDDWRGDSHLRSVSELLGYRIHAPDGGIGRVTDGLMAELTWAIRHLVVETGHWWKGNNVLVAPASIIAVRRADSSGWLDMTRESIMRAPRREAVAA